MQWQHRVLIFPDGTHSICEVYTKEDGSIWKHSNPRPPFGENLEDLERCLDMMKKSLKQKPIYEKDN